MYVSNHFNHCIKLFAPCGTLFGNNKFLFLFLYCPGADPGFQIRGANFKKLRRAEGGAKNVGVFRVKNHDFMPTNHIFSNFRGGARAGCARLPLDPPLHV